MPIRRLGFQLVRSAAYGSFPFRGPSEYTNGDYSYGCKINGDFHWFNGIEEIFYRKVKIYQCIFHGGDIVHNDVGE